MKATIIIATMLFATAAHAGNHVGQCVMPKSDIAKDGHLVVQPIVVKAAPKDKEGKLTPKLWTMTVKAQDGNMVQVVEAETKKPIGWVAFKDLEVQEPRNCN